MFQTRSQLAYAGQDPVIISRALYSVRYWYLLGGWINGRPYFVSLAQYSRNEVYEGSLIEF